MQAKHSYRPLEKVLFTIAFFAIGVGIIIIVYSLFKLASNGYSINGSKFLLEESSNYGQFIGGLVGTIWALAGFILLFITLRIQKRELDYQIDELKQTKEVFMKQSFDNTFFNLLDHLNKVVNAMEHEFIENSPLKGKVFRGRVFLENCLLELQLFFSFVNTFDKLKHTTIRIQLADRDYSVDLFDSLTKIRGEKDEFIKMQKTFEVLLKSNGKDLKHYFRLLFNIIRFIDEESKDILNLDPMKYINLLKAQMSSTELSLAFYDAFCFPKMANLLVKYKLYENLDESDFLDKSHIVLLESQSK